MILNSLSVDPAEFHRVTGWHVTPHGACRGSVCVPLPPDVRKAGGRLDATVLSQRLGMALVADSAHGVWSLGPAAAVTGRILTTALAPDLVLPQLDGSPFALSSLRGLKVVLVAWASWCGCRQDLRLWSNLREQLHPRGLEVVTVALDTGGADAAGPWITRAAPNHPSLIDSQHTLGSLFGVANVPNALWIDEAGQIVRPPEPAWLEDPHASSETAAQDVAQLPPDHRDVREEIGRMNIDAAVYERMVRDWVDRGEQSRYVLDEFEVIGRSQPSTDDSSAAAAHFELGELLHRTGDHPGAVAHWKQAHRLHPENWTYKRQAWNLEAPDSVREVPAYESGWLAEVRKIGAENYFPAIVP